MSPLIIHPVSARMLKTAGITHERYHAILSDTLMLDSWRHADADISAMPRHSAGLGSRAVAMSIFLADGITFVTGPDEDATRLTLGQSVPQTLHGELAGRPVEDLVTHPVLDGIGMTIGTVHDSVDAATGAILTHVEIARMPWLPFRSGKTTGVLAGLRRAIIG